MHKDKQKPCKFFVVPGEGPSLLGMPDVETLELLSVNCNTIEPGQMNRQINEHRMQDKSNTNKAFKDDKVYIVKHNNDMDFFLAVPNKQADMKRSEKLTRSRQQESTDVFLDIGCFKGTFSFHVKDGKKSI